MTDLDLGDGALDPVDAAEWVGAPRGREVHPASATAASATAPVIARPPVISRLIWFLCCLCGEQCIGHKRTKQPTLTQPTNLTLRR
jgi:hypothetical protein